jgi:hypothetical protein
MMKLRGGGMTATEATEGASSGEAAAQAAKAAGNVFCSALQIISEGFFNR